MAPDREPRSYRGRCRRWLVARRVDRREACSTTAWLVRVDVRASARWQAEPGAPHPREHRSRLGSGGRDPGYEPPARDANEHGAHEDAEDGNE